MFGLSAAKAQLIANELGEENPSSFSRFKTLHVLEMQLKFIYNTLDAKVKTIIERLQSEKNAEHRAIIVEVAQKMVAEELSNAEVQLRDKQKQKELEQARRAQAKAAGAAQAGTLLLQKNADEQAEQQKKQKIN